MILSLISNAREIRLRMIHTLRNLRRLHPNFTGLTDRTVASPSTPLLRPFPLDVLVRRLQV